MSDGLRGFRRRDGRWGARNHLLVLPSVVCAALVAEKIASAAGAVAIVHQHGCAQVGDDVSQTERSLFGVATNPNVGATLVVSLGCETIQGRVLANRIAQTGQRLAFVGIQLAGGTGRTIELGTDAAFALKRLIDSDARDPMSTSQLIVGVDARDELLSPITENLAAMVQDAGAGLVLAVRGNKPAWDSSLVGRSRTISFGEHAPHGEISVIEHAGHDAEQHVALAAAGAQILVSIRGLRQAAVGFVTCPVVAVSLDPVMYSALIDDFDIDGSRSSNIVADEIWGRMLRIFNGEESASERRGACDFALSRLARTM